MASVRQWPSGRWQLIVYTGRHRLSGKKVWERKTVDAPDEKTARLMAAAWELELRGSTDYGAESGTMGELFDAWLIQRARRWSPSTARGNRAKVDTYLRRPLGAVPVERVTTRQLDRLYSELAASGGKCTNDPPCDESPCEHGAPLATSTVVRLHALVSGALSQAVAWGADRTQPAEHADPGQIIHEEIELPEPAAVVRLLAAAEDDDPALATYLALAIETGLRRGALHALRWDDWHRQDKEATSTLRPTRVVSIGTDGLVERPATKSKQAPKAMTIGPHVTAALAAHHVRVRKRALSGGAALPDDAHVFSWDVLGESCWHPDSTSHRFAALRGQVGLPGVRLHDMRHLMATSLLSAGVNPRVWGSGAAGAGSPPIAMPPPPTTKRRLVWWTGSTAADADGGCPSRIVKHGCVAV